MAKKNKKNSKGSSRSSALKEKLAKLREKQQQDVADKDKGNLRRLDIFNMKDYKEVEFMKPEDGKEIRDGIYTLRLDIVPLCHPMNPNSSSTYESHSPLVPGSCSPLCGPVTSYLRT